MTTSAEISATVGTDSVLTSFNRIVAANPHTVALRWVQSDDHEQTLTFAELAGQVARVAGALASLGVARGDRVVLMMSNRPEFHVADLAVLAVGATPVSIYNSSSTEQVRYLAGHCRAVAAIVENDTFLGRFQAVQAELPALRTIIGLDTLSDAVTPWATLLEGTPSDLGAAAAQAGPDDLATVIYTSGTTGDPKGVMITHHNVAWVIESLRLAFSGQLGLTSLAGKRHVSYLPMAHIMERVLGHYLLVGHGLEVTCCPDPTQLAAYTRRVRPNILVGVPRVWEKVYAGVHAALAADPEKAQKFAEGVAAAIPVVDAMSWARATDEQVELWKFLDAVAFQQVRDLIGLDQVEVAISGAAPCPQPVLEWFRAIGVPLAEGYGMSETTALMTSTLTRVKPGTVGPPLPGIELRLAEDGEVLCRGGMVTPGYLDNPAQTAELIDADGWLHSGDIGELDEDGYLRIVDRKKELIITAGGKNVSPANLEAALKAIPLVGQVCVIGDGRPFVSALVVLDPDAARAWAAAHGRDGTDLEALAADPEVLAEIEAGRERVMTAFNNAEAVKKVAVLGAEWLPDSEQLTPTSKLKRRGVHRAFAAEIDAIYNS
ncbi:MAG: AMP-dependent synthetase/ligase [Acidimicrobiales bacterium]